MIVIFLQSFIIALLQPFEVRAIQQRFARPTPFGLQRQRFAQPKAMPHALDIRGVHARAAVGVTSLPLGVPVEIDLVAEVEE